MTTATLHVSSPAPLSSSGPDAFVWNNQFGGIWNTATNWFDNTIGTIATSAPVGASTVTITGGVNNNFVSILGTGSAAQLSLNNDVLLWGTLAVAGTVTLGASGDLDLDAGAILTAASLNLGDDALLVPGDGSTLTVSDTATLAGGFLAALDGSIVRFGALVANTVNTGLALATNTIAVDDASAIEIGSTGGSALGAITIDAGQTAVVSGALDGNVTANGTLVVQGNGVLTIDAGDPYGSAQGINGNGLLLLSEDSLLTLGVADSAAIRFGGPAAILGLDVLPTGTISGFVAGDFIDLIGGATVLATGLTYTQTNSNVATLILTKGGRAVGSLMLAGNYTGSLFHLGLDTHGDAIISLQTVGAAPAQPSLITGTAGSDTLVATANNQTLTGLGGNDSLGTGGFTGIDFKDTSANLNGSTITPFGTSSLIDLTDLTPATAAVSFTSTAQTVTLFVTDGTRSATITLTLGSTLPPGFFTVATDGGSGTIVRYNVANNDTDTFIATPGGAYGTAANWSDITTGTVAALAPSYGNAAVIVGGTGYTNITGNGFAASITTSGDVALWDSLVVGSKLAGVTGALTQTGTLVLDGAANLSVTGTATVGGLIQVGDGSQMTAAGGVSFSSNGAAVLAIGGGSVQFSGVVAYSGSQYDISAIGVDATSSIEIGTTGGATTGALTIDHGVTVNLAGTIGGNVVVSGTLAVVGTLTIAPFGSTLPSVSGTGTLDLTYGDTISLAGPDSAAILFSQTAPGSYGTKTETLALGTTMPTATISGFAPGDVISVGLIVTNLTWNGAKLTLLNGGTTVGSLLLSGLYAANQFQVQLAPSGLSSVITYAATPITAGGNSVNGNGDAYTWNNTNGGVWSVAGDWLDTTAGATPTAAPGASDAVTISDNPGSWTPQIIYGPGAAASLTIASAANTILIGGITVTGQFAVDQFGTQSGDVALYGSSNLSAGSLNVTSLLRLANASLLTILGTTGGVFISGSVVVGSDSAFRVYGGTSVISGTLAVDGTSSAEFGTAGTAAAGTVAIDNGQTVTLQGAATIAANLVVNGSLLVYSGTIGGFGGAAGTVGGAGTITIGALNGSGYMILDGPDTAAVTFQGYSVNGIPYAFEDLELRGQLRTGIITGFIAGDTVIIDRGVTGAVFSQTTSAQGTLTLTNGGVAVGTLTLNGNFAGFLFQVDIAPQTGVTTISLQTVPGAAGTASATTGTHGYSWTGASGGSWSTAANWQDTTTNTTTATVPGSNNVAVIAGSIGANQYTTIGGNGAAVDLTITGSVLLTGQVSVTGSVHVSSATGPAAALTLAAGARLTTGASVEVFGRWQVEGGSSATFPGYAFLYGGSLLALSGSTVQAGGLIGDGAGDVLAVDASSNVEIGTSTTSAAGAVTIAASAPAEFTGLIYGSVVNNGQLWLGGGGTLLIDMSATAETDPYESNPTITGSGVFVLTEGSTLGLGVADSATIDFYGPNTTLLLAAIPTATITGFTAGDQIQLDQPVTGLTYTQVNSSAASLTLTNGAATVGVLKFAGSFAGSYAFHLDAAPSGTTAVITLQTLMVAMSPPTLIHGSVGLDSLIATGNGQTITGQGGSDILSAGSYTGIDFKDYSFYLNGSAIHDFASTDMIDFIDILPGTAAETYANGVLSVTDGSHAASLGLIFATQPTSGSFHLASDGAGGTKLTWS